MCSNIDDSITDLSVVNGAQSTIAFKDTEDHLTPDTRNAPILFLHPKDMMGQVTEIMETPKELH